MPVEILDMPEEVTPLASAFLHMQKAVGGSGSDFRVSLQNLLKALNTINPQTGTLYTTVIGDWGKIITMNNGSPSQLTIHSSASAGFSCVVIQKGVGQVTFVAGGTGVIRNVSAHNKMLGQYGQALLFVESNAGTAPQVYLTGNTA